MARLRHSAPVRIPRIAILLAATALLAAGGCGTSRGPSAAGDGGREQRAAEIFAQVEQAYGVGQDGRTLDLADQLLGLYPEYPRNDRTLAMAAEAAVRKRAPDRARDYVERLATGYPDSPETPRILALGADLALAAGDTLQAASDLVRAFAAAPAPPGDPDLARVTGLVRALPDGELEGMAAEHADDPAGPFLDYLRVERLTGQGATSSARAVADDLAERAPDSPWTEAASSLAGGGRSGRYAVAGPVDPRSVGVVCPLTGRYAVLGNAFYEGALMALDATNAELGTDLRLLVEDSAGDPVASALAGRKLAGRDGCIAFLGSLMSDPTTALAVVADQLGVPLVSPTATNERIWELGDGIFQTNLTGRFEVRLLARLATTVLRKRTFGLLYPDNTEGRRHAEVFRREVESFGGEVVVETPFPPQAADFRDPILAVRKARPEVIFTPSSVDQMIMLGPQLDFYRAGSLVLGLSNWNNPKLAERSENVFERALFPDDRALLPPAWTGEFQARWDAEAYPAEATALALKAYQSTRLLLDTLGRSGASSRAELADALRLRMADQDVEASGPESFGRLVHMFREGKIVPFPAEIFAETWAIAHAPGDSLAPPEGGTTPAGGD